MNHAASFFRYRDSAKFNYDWCCGVSKIGFGFDFNPGVFHQFLFNMWDDIDRNPQIKTGSKDIGNCLLGYGLVAQTGVKFSIGEELLNDVLTTLSEKSNNQYAAINISNALKGMGLCAIQGVNITIQPKIIQALLSIMVSYPLKLTTLGEAIIGLGHLAKSGMPLQLPPEMIDSLFAIYRKQRAPEQLVLDLQSVIVDANLPEISSENMEYAANQLKQNNNSWFEITKLPTLSLHPESLSTLLDASVEITPVTELESSKINETVAPHKAAESASVTELSEIKPAVNFSESSHSFFSASPAPQMNAPTSIVDESPNTTTVSTQRLNTNAPVFVPGAGRRLFTPVARSPLSDNSEVCVINQNSITITR